MTPVIDCLSFCREGYFKVFGDLPLPNYGMACLPLNTVDISIYVPPICTKKLRCTNFNFG